MWKEFYGKNSHWDEFLWKNFMVNVVPKRVKGIKVQLGGKVLLGRKAVGGGIPMGKIPVGLNSLGGTSWSTLNQKGSKSSEFSRYSLGGKFRLVGRPLGEESL